MYRPETGGGHPATIGAMATTGDVRTLLRGTSLPALVVDELLGQASATWLMGERADVLAADLALCHPPLGDGEVRAIALPTAGPDVGWRLALLARDRPGLLARAAGALSVAGLDISSASGTTFPGRGQALLRLHARPVNGDDFVPQQWEDLGQFLRAAVGRSEAIRPAFEPVASATVDAMPGEGGRCVVIVRASDTPGLLWRAASWFEEHGSNIEAVRVDAAGGTAEGSFVVAGPVDPAGLVKALTTRPVALELPAPAKWAIRGATASVVAATALVRRARRQG